METWDAYRARRNVRAYAERSIEDADLDRILEAGRRAPSARNNQPWDFVVVTRRDTLVDLATVWMGAGHIASSAATIVVVSPVLEGRDAMTAEFDVGQAVMGMAVVAADLGIGSGHASIGDQARLRALLGLPETHRGSRLLALGYPADKALKPLRRMDRRPFSEVVHRERW